MNAVGIIRIDHAIAPHWLIQADKKLFAIINQQLTHPMLDAVAPWWRESITWTPLYLFLILFAAINCKKSSIPWIAMALITILLSDQISSSVVKPLFGRLRPCNDPEWGGAVRLLLDGCGAGYSFTSSHAANHFALAIYLSKTLQSFFPRWLTTVLLLWAASVAYAQMYVGVHYPLDVLGGAALGAGIGLFTSHFFNKKLGGLTLVNN